MRTALLVLLGASAVVDLVLGAWAGLFWRPFSEFWSRPGHDLSGEGARLVGFVLAFLLFFVAALQVIALRWVRQEKPEGHVLAIAFGSYLTLSGLATYFLFGRLYPEFLGIDVVRGAALATLGFLSMNEPSTVRSLRLPDARTREREASRRGPDRERGRDGGRDRDRGRDRERGRGRDRREGRGGRRPSGRRERGERAGAGPGSGSGPRAPERAELAEPALPSPLEGGRSLAVVVKGERKGRAPSESEGGDAADDDGGRGRKRRRRRRGGAGGRDEGAPESRTTSEPSGFEDESPREPRRRVEPASLLGESPEPRDSSESEGGFGRTRRPVRRGRRDGGGGDARE